MWKVSFPTLARRITNETYRWVSDARFHPSGSKVIATKWFTSSRSLGAGEGWEYAIPNSLDDIGPGSGKRLISKTLPLGWGPGNYEDQQIGPEQFVWHGSDSLIYSKNVGDANGRYTYSKGPSLVISHELPCENIPLEQMLILGYMLSLRRT